MSKELQFGIAAICGLIVFGFSFYFLYLKGKSRNQRFIEKAKDKGWVTKGSQVDFKIILGTGESGDVYSNDTCIVKYEYIVEGKKYYKKLSFQSPGMVTVTHPFEVKVYYDINNPKKAVCPEEASRQEQKSNGCLLTVLLTIITIEAVYQFIRILVSNF